jgi:hypothetical protein
VGSEILSNNPQEQMMGVRALDDERNASMKNI